MDGKGEVIEMRSSLRGLAASPGIGVGRAVIYRAPELGGDVFQSETIEEEIARYHRAVERFCARQEEKVRRVSETAGPSQAAILQSQAVMIQDPYLDSLICSLISSRQCAEEAVRIICGRFIETLAASEDEVPRLRAADVRDLRDGMLRQLLGLPEVDFSDLEPGAILVAGELPPSAASSLDPRKVQGIVLSTGGIASHCAILARALEIPAVMGVEGLLDMAVDGEFLAVNGTTGLVDLGLGQEEVHAYQKDRDSYLLEKESLRSFVRKKTTTKDGVEIHLAVNVNGENDILRAEDDGYDGVGLFRSEYLYQDGSALLDEEKQFRVYRRMALAMRGKPLVIRTLDVGGDKEILGLEQEPEDNPFLGCRGLRLSLQEERFFQVQLKATLRASAFGDVRLMVPMVSSLNEVQRVKDILERAKGELRRRGEAFREDFPLGVMIETPAAALTADLLAKEVDFFSIGTNDLTQYTMAADRGNSRVAYLYSCYDPAMLREIRYVIKCAGEAGISVSVCGEAASDVLFVPILLGLGVRNLSVHPVTLLAVRRQISLWTMREARELASQALRFSSQSEVHDFLERGKRI